MKYMQIDQGSTCSLPAIILPKLYYIVRVIPRHDVTASHMHGCPLVQTDLLSFDVFCFALWYICSNFSLDCILYLNLLAPLLSLPGDWTQLCDVPRCA